MTRLASPRIVASTATLQRSASPDDARLPSPAVVDQAARLAAAFVVLGVVIRLSRYLLRFPLWHDEVMLAYNYLDRGYAELLAPLPFNQVAPPLFLWIELTATRLFGFSEFSLRLFPICMGVASVALFWHVARRLLSGTALVAAVAMFAVNYYAVRHAAEAKPYASDLFVALALGALAIEWLRRPDQRRWLWIMAAAAPFAIWLAYPAAFVGGGLSLALAPTLIRRRSAGDWLAFGVYNIALAGAFVGMLSVVANGQYNHTADFMLQYWEEGFPPAEGLWTTIVWFVDKHTGEMFACPVGADRGGSTLITLAFITGLAALVRGRRREIAVATVAIMGLALVAAVLHRYPYGGPRLTQYLVPYITLVAGAGFAAWIGWLRRPEARTAAFGGAVALLAVVGCGIAVRDVVKPYKHRPDYEHRGFAEWFWTQRLRHEQIACASTDLGVDLYPTVDDEVYRCYQRIYSRSRGDAGRAMPLAPKTAVPLRCVVYGEEGAEQDQAATDRWLREMQQQYVLAERETYRVQIDHAKEPQRIGRYEVYWFEPKAVEVADQSNADLSIVE